jgi:hypothetical protein
MSSLGIPLMAKMGKVLTRLAQYTHFRMSDSAAVTKRIDASVVT